MYNDHIIINLLSNEETNRTEVSNYKGQRVEVKLTSSAPLESMNSNYLVNTDGNNKCNNSLNEKVNKSEVSHCKDQRIDEKINSSASLLSMNSSYLGKENKNIERNYNGYEKNDKRFNLLWNKLRIDHIKSDLELKGLSELLKDNANIFSLEGEKLTETSVIEHHIRTVNEIPINAKTYRYPKVHNDEVNKQLKKLLDEGIIRHSQSPWCSPLWVVPKKSDINGNPQWRMVIDFRKLNDITISDSYPIPNITDILDQLGGAKYFTTLDLKSGFHQIPLSKESIEKTAFSTPYGHFEYTRMPFGLKNAPSCFQRMMNNVLSDLLGKECFVYIDDIVVYGSSLEEHNERLKNVFQKLKEANLKIQIDKSEFLKEEVQYLGYLITNKGLLPNIEKVKAINNLQRPKNPKEIKSFIGMIGYYRKFIKNFSIIASPLYKLLKKNAAFIWKEEHSQSFDELKRLLTEFTLLQYPKFEKQFTITTDASNLGLGAVLSQECSGKDLPIHFISRTLNKAEVNYTTTEKECLAIVWAIQQFRPYLYGQKFIIKTDHRPLTWLFNVKDPGSRLIRWRLKLEEYDYKIIYKKGVDNVVADELSRNMVFPVFENPELDTLNNSIKTKLSKEQKESVKEVFGEDFLTDEELEEEENVLRRIYEEEYGLEEPSTSRAVREKLDRNLIRERNVSNNPVQKDINVNNQGSRQVVEEIRNQDNINEGFSENIEVINNKEEQQKIIKEYHDGLIGGHGGQKATISRIKERFYWVNLNKDVIEYIQKCNQCQKQKINRHPRRNPMKIVTSADHSFEKVAMDLTGPYVENKRTIYSLTIQDDLSKFIKYIPIENKRSETVARAFTEEWVLNFGLPEYILTDNGGEFINEVMKELCKMFGIKHLRTSNAYPQSNGSAERSHARLGEYMRLVNKGKGKPEYSKLFRYAAFCHNTAIHNSTGFTPYEMIFGRKANVPSEFCNLNFKTTTDYTQELQLKLIRMETEAKRTMLGHKTKSKERYDKKINSNVKEFKKNDLILVENDKRDKSSEKYVGPYKIIKVLDNSVIIRRNNNSMKYNKSRIKHYKN